MGKNLSKSYDEQEKAIQNGEVSFELNIFILLGKKFQQFIKDLMLLNPKLKKIYLVFGIIIIMKEIFLLR